jgi:actin-like ATPase involved in cell morphogenesis
MLCTALKKKNVLHPHCEWLFCIPSGITEVEMRAVKESYERMVKKYI